MILRIEDTDKVSKVRSHTVRTEKWRVRLKTSFRCLSGPVCHGMRVQALSMKRHIKTVRWGNSGLIFRASVCRSIRNTATTFLR
jgi:hypothetical protein